MARLFGPAEWSAVSDAAWHVMAGKFGVQSHWLIDDIVTNALGCLMGILANPVLLHKAHAHASPKASAC